MISSYSHIFIILFIQTSSPSCSCCQIMLPIQMNNGPSTPAPAQNPHQEVIGMFPDLDLTQTIKDFRHMSPPALASWIVDHMDELPKRGMKRNPAEGTNSDDSTDEDEIHPGGLLVEKLLADLIVKLRMELQNHQQANQRQRPQSALHVKAIKNYLCDQFTFVRMDYIQKIIQVFKLAIVPSAIACFFVENNFGVRLQKFIPNVPQVFWWRTAKPLQIVRKKQFGGYQIGQFDAEFQRYVNMMANYRQGEYKALITADFQLVNNYKSIKYELSKKDKEDAVECLVCFELAPANRIVLCSVPTPTAHQQQEEEDGPSTSHHQQEEEDGPSTSHHQQEEEDGPSTSHHQQEEEDGPSTSRHQQEEEDGPSTSRHQQEEDGPEIDTEEEIASSTVHAFCRACVRGQAKAATSEQPLADGGVGLRCMVPDCKNPILYAGIRMILTREIRKKLDERIIEENIGTASLDNLERCKRCNFPIQMDVDKTENKVFDCLNCGSKFCRNCDEAWDDNHFGITCEEMAVKSKKDRKLEKELNEAIIRKCPRCAIVFMKSDGCNKMTCRCGMTQCYICRESNIGYAHFCPHLRNPQQPNAKCKHCNRTCLLYEDPNKKDDQLIHEIRKKWEQQEKDNNNEEEQPTEEPRKEGVMPTCISH